MSYSDILKYSYKSKPLYPKRVSNSTNSTNSLINNLPTDCSHSVVLEHLVKPERNNNFIYKLFNFLEIDPDTIKCIYIISHYANIIVSSQCANYKLLNNKNRKTIKVEYPNISIRPFMNETDIKMGRIMFHAFKAMLTKYKCAFNHRLAIYELRSFKTKINSNNIEPMIGIQLHLYQIIKL